MIEVRSGELGGQGRKAITLAGKFRSLLAERERRGALWLLCLMSLGMLLEMLGIGLVIPVVAILMQDDLTTRYPVISPLLESLGHPGHGVLVTGAMLGLVGIFLVKNLFLAFLAWRQARFAYGAQVQISQRLFTIYLHQPYTFHLQRNSAQLIRNVTGEVNLFTSALIGMLAIASESLVLLGIAALLLWVEPMGALVSMMVVGLAAWVFYRSTRSHLTRWGKARQYHDGLRIQHLQQGLGGAKDVKLLGREGEFLAQYYAHNVQSGRVGQMQITLQQFPRLWLELLAVSGLAVLVLSMVWQEREMNAIIPALALFAAAAFRLIPSVNRILSSMQSLRFRRPVIDTLYDELKLEAPEPKSSPAKGASQAKRAFRSEIRLSRVSYAYPGAADVALDELSLVIRQGEFVGFIGPSGSGKSTLADVILGLLPPGAGEIRVDGQDVQQDMRAWQDQIGYVPQSIFLTDDTLRRNVAFGLPEEQIDEAAVWRAIKDAQLEDFVTGLPNGLETVVGERGIRLSGGQRQRIGIARALYHDPAVLVLDEATSALDAETESGVMQAVTALQRRKTILIVAHRLSTVVQCDRLYRLEHGRVVAQGTPAEILPPEREAASS